MSHSVPDKEALSVVWQKIKNRSIPLKPLTKAEYDVLDEISKSADVAYLVFDADGGLILRYKELSITNSSGESVITTDKIYFVEETRIGTWIDGKPLYRRILNGVFPSKLNTMGYFETIVDNVQTVTALHGIAYSATVGVYCPVADSSTSIGYYPSLKKVGVIATSSGYLNTDVFVIMEYTKTTD